MILDEQNENQTRCLVYQQKFVGIYQSITKQGKCRKQSEMDIQRNGHSNRRGGGELY